MDSIGVPHLFINMNRLLVALYERAMKTRDARFEAARRMDRCNSYSIACIAFLSLEIIAINIFQLVGTDDSWDKYVSATTIFLSVFALVLSMIVNQAQYSLKCSQYRLCALSLDELCYAINRELKSNQSITKEIVARYESDYISIRKESNLNHRQCDYRWASRSTEFIKNALGFKNNPINYYAYRVKLWWSHYIFSTYFIYLLITLIGAFFVIIFMAHVSPEGGL